MLIPSNIAYFIFGFITCLVLIIIICIQVVRNENKKRQELINMILKDLTNNETKAIDKDKDE